MKANKTQPTEQTATDFIQAIADEKMRQDCQTVAALMEEIAQEAPQIWGGNIVGFKTYRYQYTSGREGEWFKFGFAPRKGKLTLYFSQGFENHTELLAKLGKHSIGKSCLYVKKLADIDMQVLKELLQTA